MRIQNLLPFGAIIASTALFACGSDTGSSGPGGSVGGAKAGGASSTATTTAPGAGGSSSAGGASQTGGANPTSGGATAAGGTTNGSQGGANTGGTGTKATGGTSSNTGGKTGVGGTSASTGGKTGTATGGKTGVGGTSSAGGTSGNVTTGGKTGVGGTSAGVTGGESGATGGSSSATTGGTSSGDRPPGYWMSADWTYPNPISYDMQGCAWTGKDSEVPSSTTSVTPQDFTKVAVGGPFHISGKVTKDAEYRGVALLGFNLSQDPGDATQCVYDPASASDPNGPPAVAPPSGTTGIAVNFSKTGAFTLRVQVQGQDGATNADHRWCYTITDAAGPIFAKFSDFYTACWFVGSTDPANSPGNKYNNEPISAVVFTVPGNTEELSYDFTINGWAFGTSAGDAPTGGTQTVLEGDIGGAGVTDKDFERVKVKADGHSYIIQNNNWGNPSGTNQTIHYKGNSFTITEPTGAGPGGGVPASFPSIYIGANGDTQNGVYSTTSDDNLPKVVSTIQSIQTTFQYSSCSGNGYNAAYDVWFSANKPTSMYKDAISGFVMVWLCDPGDAQPIGSVQRSNVSLGGKTWNVWVGPRGGSGSNSNAPVVSYVLSSGSTTSLTFNLLDFIKDAAQNGIQSSWYLTDVFAGFEIWNGGGTDNLAVNKFTCVVQ